MDGKSPPKAAGLMERDGPDVPLVKMLMDFQKVFVPVGPDNEGLMERGKRPTEDIRHRAPDVGDLSDSLPGLLRPGPSQGSRNSWRIG